jgi:hypothetical protein
MSEPHPRLAVIAALQAERRRKREAEKAPATPRRRSGRRPAMRDKAKIRKAEDAVLTSLLAAGFLGLLQEGLERWDAGARNWEQLDEVPEGPWRDYVAKMMWDTNWQLAPDPEQGDRPAVRPPRLREAKAGSPGKGERDYHIVRAVMEAMEYGLGGGLACEVVAWALGVLAGTPGSGVKAVSKAAVVAVWARRKEFAARLDADRRRLLVISTA